MKKGNKLWNLLLMMWLVLVLTNSCKKEAIKVIPTITVTSVTNITATTASSGGEVTANGGATVTASGVCWSINQNPTTADNKTSSGSGTGSFTSSLTGLTPGVTYNIRAYAINSVGTGYSSQLAFQTLALAPVLTTTDLSAITATTATSGGNITNDGGSSVTARGVCWSESQNPTIDDSKISGGTGSGSFTSAITGLTPGATYYVRAYATNSIGTAYGNQVIATTKANLPTLITKEVSVNTVTTATYDSYVTNDGGALIIADGVCWSTNPNPTIADKKTTDGYGIPRVITGLVTNTTYYVRAYATNSAGTAYGNEITFILYLNFPDATVNDIDGNVYHTVKIGTQVWMVENLRSTHYANGLNIKNITSNSEWYNLGQGYCWYNNNIAYKNTYGALYNYWLIKYANSYGGICPLGWHISSDADWTTLINYLGGETNAGSMLKEIGTTNWSSPNNGATNKSGFTALPGGFRGDDGSFGWDKIQGYWWTGPESEGFPNYTAYSRNLKYDSGSVFKSVGQETYGLSVRCVKD